MCYFLYRLADLLVVFCKGLEPKREIQARLWQPSPSRFVVAAVAGVVLAVLRTTRRRTCRYHPLVAPGCPPSVPDGPADGWLCVGLPRLGRILESKLSSWLSPPWSIVAGHRFLRGRCWTRPNGALSSSSGSSTLTVTVASRWMRWVRPAHCRRRPSSRRPPPEVAGATRCPPSQASNKPLRPSRMEPPPPRRGGWTVRGGARIIHTQYDPAQCPRQGSAMRSRSRPTAGAAARGLVVVVVVY